MDLRILGGIYKHRRIKLHSSFHDRPTLVRSRRMIFDILMNYIEVGFSFLDVFAGSGVMGIEALSRGASKVVFFDINSLYLKTIEKNLINMEKIIGIYSTIKTNALCPPDGSNFDVIFLDPPYEKYYIINQNETKKLPEIIESMIKS